MRAAAPALLPTAPQAGVLSKADTRLLGAVVACALIAYFVPFAGTKYAMAVLCALMFLAGSGRSFAVPLSIFIISLPFFDIAYNGSILVPGLNLQTLAVAYFFILAATKSHESGPGVRNPVVVPLLTLVAITTVSAIVSSMTSDESLVDLLTRVKNWFAYALLALVAFRHVNTRADKLLIVVAIVVAVMLNVAQSMRVSMKTLSLALDFMHHRSVSFIALQPNLYAGFLALNLFLFISLLIYYPMTSRVKLLLSICTSFVALNLIYTMSRGAWLAFIAAAIFIVGTKSRKFLLPLLLLSGVAYFASPDAASERWASSFTGEYDPKLLLEEKVEQEEAASRIVQWRSFPTLMAENPIFGIGMGQYAKLVYDRGYFPKLKSAHATLIEIGVEQGLIGLICYVSLLLVIYRTASRLARQTTDPLEKSLAVALVGATVCLALLDLSGTRFRNANITAYYWILVAITLNAPAAVRRPLRAFAA